MANEAFALSPMSARAAEPNEQDYDAIREAFMETARGRWFLGEYAKRNRNADTRMVLDAVAKIEETLAAQRQPVVVDRLPEALIAIRRAVEETEAVAANAANPAAIVAALAPIQRGVRIIKEISWRWREIGADGRICDLIDSQLAAIEGACAQVSGVDPRAELKAAFDLLRDRIAQTDGGAAAEPAASSVAQAAPTAMPNETPVVFTEPQDIAASALPAADEAAEAEAAMDAAFAQDGAVAGDEGAPETVAFAETVAEPAAIAEIEAELSFDAAADAEDEAVLEAIALEMAAPDPDFDEIIEPVEMAAADPEPMTAEVAQADAAPIIEEPVAAATSQAADEAAVTMESLARLTDAIADAAAEVDLMELPAITADAAPVATLPMPSPVTAAAPEPSLGATILASGMLQKPRSSMNDPLAPLRRMTQAEKIAFFS